LKLISKIISKSEEDTFLAGERISKTLSGGELIGIEGDLGAGKTVFVKGLAAGLDIDWKAAVDSPTFKLINSYSGRLTLHHLDLYRLSSAEDVLGIGFFDLFDPRAVIAVEWAEKLQRLNLRYNGYIKIIHAGDAQRELLHFQ
jgi:tRNA threonylcarbamoyladenosine biosynthesis protein TsaE